MKYSNEELSALWLKLTHDWVNLPEEDDLKAFALKAKGMAEVLWHDEDHCLQARRHIPHNPLLVYPEETLFQKMAL